MPANPYAQLTALVDCTRELDPEEMAELQLEQGYADRALAIYERLLQREPANPHYRRRRDWLARMATVRQRPVRCVSASTAPPADDPPPAVEGPACRPPTEPPRVLEGTLRGMVAPGRGRVAIRRASGAAPAVSSPVATAPVATAPVVTAPVATAPVVTAPVATAPVVTAPVVTAPAAPRSVPTAAAAPVVVRPLTIVGVGRS